DETHDGHRATVIQNDAVASPLRDAGLEGVEDRLPVFDTRDSLRLIESIDFEIAVIVFVFFVPLRGKKVLIVGAARSGIGAAKFLVAQGAVVALTDQKPIEKWTPEALALKELGVGLLPGEPPSWLLDQLDL